MLSTFLDCPIGIFQLASKIQPVADVVERTVIRERANDFEGNVFCRLHSGPPDAESITLSSLPCPPPRYKRPVILGRVDADGRFVDYADGDVVAGVEDAELLE